ncbi:hypothetical protein [Wolbachia endosymbiont of Cantharis cryptica]|uniref:hypothetical protein n=1 Tax=Wolbachia endosymbiont of Cantharis cryptica TaxID=3066132 RepID=UPI00376EFBD5
MLGFKLRDFVSQKVDTDAAKNSKIKSRSNSGDSGIEEFEYILDLTEITNILSKAINENNYEELEKIVSDIESYEGQSVSINMEALKTFCLEWLNLDLNAQENGTFFTIFSLYKMNELGEYEYSVKELVLLAIAANDELAKKYKDVLVS